jgi:hypothetical protein
LGVPQEERAEEMAAVLRNFAIAQAHTAAETAEAWRTLIPPSTDGEEPQ